MDEILRVAIWVVSLVFDFALSFFPRTDDLVTGTHPARTTSRSPAALQRHGDPAP